MRRSTCTALVALLTLSAVAGTAVAAATAAPGTPAVTAVDAPTDEVGGLDVAPGVQTDENLTVNVQTPRTVATNVTQNYSVDVADADGNVTVTWSFDGETKRGETVTHTWREAGNATVTVTVTDADGDTASRERTVEVVDYADEAEAGNPLDNVASIALLIFMLGGVPLILLLFVVPKTMEAITDSF